MIDNYRTILLIHPLPSQLVGGGGGHPRAKLDWSETVGVILYHKN